MPRNRRKGEEVKTLAQEAKALVDGGMTIEQAIKQSDISRSIYDRHILGRAPWKPAKKKKAKPKANGADGRIIRPEKEVAKLIAKVDELRATGMKAADALKKVGLTKTVYFRRKTGGRMVRGTINVASLPPRPNKKHGGARKARGIDMTDVASVAMRISKLDKKIAEVNALSDERKNLAIQLLRLLKA